MAVSKPCRDGEIEGREKFQKSDDSANFGRVVGCNDLTTFLWALTADSRANDYSYSVLTIAHFWTTLLTLEGGSFR